MFDAAVMEQPAAERKDGFCRDIKRFIAQELRMELRKCLIAVAQERKPQAARDNNAPPVRIEQCAADIHSSIPPIRCSVTSAVLP